MHVVCECFDHNSSVNFVQFQSIVPELSQPFQMALKSASNQTAAAASVLATNPQWTGFTELVIRLVAQLSLITALALGLIVLGFEYIYSHQQTPWNQLIALTITIICCFAVAGFAVWTTLEMTLPWFSTLNCSFFLVVTIICCTILPHSIPTIVSVSLCASIGTHFLMAFVMKSSLFQF